MFVVYQISLVLTIGGFVVYFKRDSFHFETKNALFWRRFLARMFFSKTQSIVGVDLGTSYIKVAQISHTKPQTLNTYGIVELDEPIGLQSGDGAIAQAAKRLRDLLDQAQVTTKHAVASLPNNAVFTSVIDMPAMPERELAQAIPFEAKKYVPLPFDEVLLSWSVLGQNDGGTSQKVLLIAVPKVIRETYVRIFELAKLDLEIIEIEALSLIRSLITNPAKNSVIIDIGGKSTGINFVKQGQLQLTRNINVGGDTVTNRIAETLNVTPQRAAQFKHDFGMTGNDFLPEAIKPVLSVIKNEAAQLLSIYKARNVAADEIILVGGGALVPGLIGYFGELGLPVVMGAPASSLSVPAKAVPLVEQFKSQLAVAIGLAMRHES
jgi:type IV pilus assembly protein PilM